MNKIGASLAAVFFIYSSVIKGQDSISKEIGYQFTPVIEIPATPIKDQNKSGTCWAYSSLSFFESELIRMGKPEIDLSEMFVVWNCYSLKAEKYVRMHGNINFGGGGAFHDATWVIRNFGMIPDSVYSGLKMGEKRPVHGEMDGILKSFVDGVVKNEDKKLSPIWNNAFKDMLNNYLGTIPEMFVYKGISYSPRSFVSDYLKINTDDYVEIGSFTHHPFYEKFILEVPDNWLWDEIYNVPLAEMMEIIDYSLANGYSVAWGADTSDKGFATKSKGIAVVPEIDTTQMSVKELVRWKKLNEKDQQDELYKFEKPGKEKTITQEFRQTDFDNYSSTDDHGMHIIGTAKDQNGNLYYKVKNSWGDYNDYDGYFYASKPYIELRTIDFMVHKDAIPKSIRNKLGLR